MDVHARSFSTATVALISTVTLALNPAATPTLGRLAEPAVRLSSAVQLFDPDPVGSAAVAAQSLGADIEALYNTVEPWVAYDVNLLSWAVDWVLPLPLGPQLTFFYDLGESIVQSTLFNTIDVLDGSVSFAEALGNINTATTDALNAFANAEIGWIDSLLPPAPPLELDPGALADVATLFGHAL